MRIFLAGATGAIGRELVPMLLERGDTVIGTTTNPAKSHDVEAMGAEPVVVDILDRAATVAAVAKAKPDVVMHQATALTAGIDVRRMDRSFAQTNRLRTAGTDHLLAAAVEAGAARIIVQSYSGLLESDPPASARRTVDAVRHIDDTVPGARGIEGLVLRYGSFYGPGTSIGPGGEITEMVRRRRFPIVGDGGGVWSFVHVADAAAAAVSAIDRGAPGVYHVVDDEPAPVREWLPVLAETLGAQPPRHVPAAVARLLIGANGVRMMTATLGSSNAKAKTELGWTPAHPTWREGFRTLSV
jgi:2-alkyl-3-oxoalkanoate reductase